MKISKWIKENKIVVVVSATVLALILIIASIVLLQAGKSAQEQQQQESEAEQITFKFADDYETFDVSVEDFYKKIKYELKSNDIKVEELLPITYKDEYNLYNMAFCEWDYVIKLSNNDQVLLCSKNDDKAIGAVGYDFSNNIGGADAGFFIGKIASLFISPDFDKDDFTEQLNTAFISEEGGFIRNGRNLRFAYNHILFGIDFNYGVDSYGKKDANSEYYFAIFSPIPETTHEEWQDNLDKWWTEWEAKNKEEQAEQAATEEAEAKQKEEYEKQQAAEEAERLKQKERTFTAGKYEVGVDIPTGKYNIIAISGRGSCIVRGKVYEIFTPNPDAHSIDKYNNVKLEWGDEIEIDSTLKVRFEALQ